VKPGSFGRMTSRFQTMCRSLSWCEIVPPLALDLLERCYVVFLRMQSLGEEVLKTPFLLLIGSYGAELSSVRLISWCIS